ncbi:MAG: purine-binding chemotaxis protein CheW [Candidatus Lindowbacteria bacterium]|nr:purine-binding chemotaxis protein CheW [Candidatus Lindowbacteria bacterium]
MAKLVKLVVFTLDGQRYALRLSAVERIVRAVEVTALPEAPDIVLGVVNVQGRVIPVLNIRKRFHLPERELSLTDQMIIARTSRRSVVLLIDAVTGAIELSEGEVIPKEEIFPNLKYVEGVAALREGMTFIHDLDSFLSLQEEKALQEAMSASAEARNE